MPAVGEPNQSPDAAVLRDMHPNLKIDEIHNTNNYPCILDDNNLANASAIYCHCEAYNSEFHRNTN
jgi:hypothetical protein